MRVAAILFALILTMRPAVGEAGIFPPRPTGVPLQYLTGLLTEFGAGEGLGWFTLRDVRSGKERLLRIGSPMKVDGHIEHCLDPTRPRDRLMCYNWPATVVIGRTIVKATCYAFHDARMDPKYADYPACDQLDIVRAKGP
jgi:hypothetical protein